MKVSTDACLFGAAVKVEQAQHILDIGTGTGLLALMAAQRTEARIVAVELDAQAAQQAEQNIQASPWADRVKLFRQSIQAFAEEYTRRFDCILCNPPFFTDHMASSDAQRHRARHNDSLSFAELASAVRRLLKQQGIFQALLPASEKTRFLQACEQEGLGLRDEIAVRPTATKPINRVILTVSLDKNALETREILIHQGNGYSPAFRELLSPYYLKL